MNNLIYYFDGRKTQNNININEAFVKGVFKDAMYNSTNNSLTTNGTAAFDAIWGNTSLRGNLFPSLDYVNNTLNDLRPQALILFQTMVANTSNSFYNFIKVR